MPSPPTARPAMNRPRLPWAPVIIAPPAMKMRHAVRIASRRPIFSAIGNVISAPKNAPTANIDVMFAWALSRVAASTSSVRPKSCLNESKAIVPPMTALYKVTNKTLLMLGLRRTDMELTGREGLIGIAYVS